MRFRSILIRSLCGLALAAVLCVVSVLANNPIAVNSGGNPAKWSVFPILYTVDNGMLGALSKAQADGLTVTAFGAWSGGAVATTNVSATQNASGLGPDGDVNTVAEFNAVGCVGVNPIVYDNDGSLTDGLLGGGASNNVLGFAGPCAIQPTGSPVTTSDTIVGGRATLNGKLITSNAGLAFSRSKGVFIHELGHFLGLGHSQVNLNCATNLASCPSNTPGGDLFGVPTMFPTLLNQTEDAGNTSYSETLTVDDTSAISTLYPNPNNSFANSLGTITGSVFFSDQVNEGQGFNVIARRVGDPRVTAISNVSGMFAQVDYGNPALNRPPSSAGSPDVARRGDYTIPGLPPGTYTVEIESIRSTFIDGSSVGPVSDERRENIPLPAAEECFGGPESNTDNPATCQDLVLGAGMVLANINFILNDTLATMDAFDTAARNETIATANAIAAGATTASISANNGPDVDVYAIIVPAGQVLTVEIFSRRLLPQSFLDSVIELTDPGGNRLVGCRIGSNPTLYDQQCLDDDFTSSGGFTLDSKFAYAGAPGTVYLRVTDALGDFRPDFVYNVVVSFAAAGAEVVPPATPVSFATQYVDMPPPAAKVFTVTNVGSANMTLSASPIIINNADFTPNSFVLASGSTCTGNFVLPPGAACIVNVTFQPTVVAPVHRGSFSVFSNASLSPHVFNFEGVAVDFSLAGAGTMSRTVTAGQVASFDLNFMRIPAVVGLPAPTAFTVAGLPTGASALFNPQSFAAGPGVSPAALNLTVNTTPRPALVLPAPSRRFPRLPVLFVVLLVLAVVSGTLSLMRRRKAAPRWVASYGLLAVVCILAVLGACGGGGGAPNPNGTPAGTYPLTVTATSGTVSRTTTVTLTVQ